MTDHPSKIGIQRWIVPAGLIVGALFAVIMFAGYSWQSTKSDSKLTDAVTHTETAVFLQEASVEGNATAELLGAYVLEGDQSLLPQIQNHTTTALGMLTGAISSSGSDQVRQIAIQGTSLAEGAGTIIALRQVGDIEGASAALTDLGPQFESFGTAMQAAIDTELAAAVSLTNSSENADDAASWLLITGIAVTIAISATLLFVASRSLFRRRASEKPSPA